MSERIIREQRKIENKRRMVLLAFAVACLVGLVLDVMTGPSMLPINDVIAALLRLTGVENTTHTIVYDLRLPIALMALVVGASHGKSLYLGVGSSSRVWRIVSDCVWWFWFAYTICCADWGICHDHAGLSSVVFIRLFKAIRRRYLDTSRHCPAIYFSIAVIAGAIYRLA